MATNTLRKSESFKIGEKAESIFEKVAKKKQFKVYKANKHQNINQHIDFFISCYHFNFSVDVKARKKINRGDSKVNDEWTWIEFKMFFLCYPFKDIFCSFSCFKTLTLS